MIKRIHLKKIYLVLVSIIAFLSLNIESSNPLKVLILGDSISAGYGIPLKNQWITILQDDFNSKQKNIKLINASVSGETTIGGKSKVQKLLKDHKPNYILIELGGNDGLRGYPVSKIKDNLIKICDIALKQDVNVGLMQIRLPPNYGKRYVQSFENIYKDISKIKEIILIPFMLNTIALETDLMQEDGIHPNIQAQKLISEKMAISINYLIQ
ncbi:MAG: arylesterase [SAR86 cluster bacterium]|jgi:acyl-CoA thioesterase I|nr:arylesterase [SAR86 cluster bacterium]